ncbi:glycosyltransferase [Latilactobacillus sakei]
MIIKTINVMFAADNNYADQLLIAIKSILAHIPAETTVHFLILDNELTPQTKCLVRQITKQSHQVDFIKINQQLLKNCPESNHINKTAYYRILAPQILLRKGINRVLYLDVDILVQTDITPLYESHLGTNIVGAIIDPGQALALPRLGVSPEKSGNIYFNSGVMLIDTFRWEENQISELTLRFINQHPERIIFHDQDALNAILAGKVQLLHPAWNVQNSLIFRKHQPINATYKKLFDEAIAQPKIVHFTTHNKPWNTLKEHPFLAQYQAYSQQLGALKKDSINIVSAVNAAFIEPLAILYASILNHNDTQRHYSFYVLEDHLTEADKIPLKQVVAAFDADLTFLKVDEALLANIVESDRILKSAYYRILIPQVLNGIDRALYLDCDALCNVNLERLWNIDLGEFPLAAVEDAGFHQRLEKMAIKCHSTRYFNSGMMLMDLKKWRQQAITEKTLDFINHHPEKLRFHDQDALNAVLHDQWLHLHPKWNAQTNIIMDKITPPQRLQQQFIEAKKAPAIVHFCGHEKPWHAVSTHPFTPQYRYYRHRFLKPKRQASIIPFSKSTRISLEN